ncbi:MAG: cation-translocating P-type ATPase, partial [Myxococcales bacterium]|nr:cation-translocating P-type ATPase [Myxococcales bacterium]
VRSLGEEEKNQILSLALALQVGAQANHPVARAIVEHAQATGTEAAKVRRPVFHPGRGITATTPEGEPVVLGNRQLLLENGISVALAEGDAAIAESRGHSVLFLGAGGRVRGLIALRDTLRPGGRAAVQRLFDIDADVVLMSGDHRASVNILAKHLDIDHVRADLPPEDRGAEVTRLREAGRAVAVVGHASRDESALAAANVPVLLSAAGSTDNPPGAVLLASDDVRDAATALWVARAARQASTRGMIACLIVGATTVILASSLIASPAVAAAASIMLDAYALPAGTRLLRRFALRMSGYQ